MPEPGKGPTEWFEARVGVGPWEQEYPNEPRPTGPEYDGRLPNEGDRCNVVDAYHYWTVEVIIAELGKCHHPLHITIENFENDPNTGTVIHTANASLVEAAYIVGRKRRNRRGVMATDHYQHPSHHKMVPEVISWAREHDLAVVVVDSVPGPVPIGIVELPEHCLLLFGQEGPGVTEGAQRAASLTVLIAQFGSTRSINTGVAAGVAMHSWICTHADITATW